MKKAITVILGLVGLPLSLEAADNTRVDWQVSPDNIHWSSQLRTPQGHEVWVQAVVTYTGTASPVGLASFVFQPTVSGWDPSGPSLDGSVVYTPANTEFPPYHPHPEVDDPSDPTQFGRVTPFKRLSVSSTSMITGFVHTDQSGGAPPGSWLRIAQLYDTSWIGGTGNTTGAGGVPISQLSNVGRTTADPPFNSATSQVLVYKFGIFLSEDYVQRTLVIDSPAAGFGNRNSATGDREVYWYGSMVESTGSIRGTPVIVPATIYVQPCGSADFDGDGDAATDADIEAFFACMAGNCCATCGSPDFNGDGDPRTDADIEAFFRVLAGGTC
jgi:hypothetical protein